MRKEVTGPDGIVYRTVGAMCCAYGIDYKTYQMRMQNGWDESLALTLKPWSREAKEYSRELRIKRAEKPKHTENAYILPVKGFIW